MKKDKVIFNGKEHQLSKLMLPSEILDAELEDETQRFRRYAIGFALLSLVFVGAALFLSWSEIW